MPNFDAAACGMSKKEARASRCFVQYAIAASEEAWAQAGIDMEAEDATRAACVGKRHWRPENSSAVATRFRRRAPSA